MHVCDRDSVCVCVWGGVQGRSFVYVFIPGCVSVFTPVADRNSARLHSTNSVKLVPEEFAVAVIVWPTSH